MKTFDDEVILIGREITTHDEEGNPTKVRSEKTVFCNELSVYGSDFYNASQVGLKPQAVLEIHHFEYDNEDLVNYKGIEYDIIRTYKKGEYIELTVGEKSGT